MSNNNNLVTEIGLMVISVAIIVGAIVLRVLGDIDYVQLAEMIAGAVALWGANSLYKAPSPGQQTQLNIQQQNLQTLLSQFLNVLPGLIQRFQPQPIPGQVLTTQPQPQQTAQPLQVVPTPVPTPARGPAANSSAMVNPGFAMVADGSPLQGSQQGPLLPAIDLRNEPQPITFPQRNWNDSQLMPSVQPPGQQQRQ